ncbi:MAG TPA: hypothetical protein VFD66_07770 [Verrucomicrobiae bacterium]|nr:hypothetical protein [Verrucomicrobiae bacterium]
MKKGIAVSVLLSALVCICGCGKPIDESRLIGAWQFNAQRTIMVLETNHAYTLKGENDNGPATLGEWRLQGHRLITIGQIAKVSSGSIRIHQTNDSRIKELTESRMVLKNWGGPTYALTRVSTSR